MQEISTMFELFKHEVNLSNNKERAPFSAVFSNPPYQTGKSSETDIIQKSPINIFQHFQETSDEIAEQTCMIYPGGRWASQTGNGMREFGKKLANSKYLQQVIYYSRTLEIFSKTEVSGGVTIVHKNNTKDNNGKWNLSATHNGQLSKGLVSAPGSNTISLFPVLANLEQKVRKHHNGTFSSINSRKLSFNAYKIQSSFAVKNPEAVIPCDESFSNSPNPDAVRLLVNHKEGKGGRATWFWADKSLFDETVKSYISKWKVIISAKNINGLNGRKMQVQVLPPNSAHSFVRVTIGLFDSEDEALNYFKYLSTDFGRCLIAASGGLVTNFAVSLPDLEDYSSANKVFDLSLDNVSLNRAICEFYSIDEFEMEEMTKFVGMLEDFS